MHKKFRCMLFIVLFAGLSFVVSSLIVTYLLIGSSTSKVTWPISADYSPENVTFPASDGLNLKGWFLPQIDSTKAIVLLHGVRANREQVLSRALWLHSLGYNVLLYDARGCGESTPALHSFGHYETRDLIGALNWLQDRGMPRIGCLGCSQGAATILLASGQLPPSVHAVVAEASYATLQNTIDDHFRAYTALPGSFFGMLVVPFSEVKLGLKVAEVSPLHEISKLQAPLFILGGTSDKIAPPAGTYELYEAATCDKSLWMIEGARHVDLLSYTEAEYKRRVGNFLQKHL